MKSYFLIFLVLIHHVYAATFEWIGNGDGISFYQEANWQVQGGGAVTGNPITFNVEIVDDLIFTGNNPNISSELRMAASATLLNNGGTLVMTPGGGIKGGTITVNNSGTIQSDWVNNATINLSQATITLRGGGSPLSNSTIACTGSAWSITFTNETSAAVQAEHLTKITINGQPAVLDTNCTLTPQGASGSILTPGGAVDSDNDNLSDAWEQQYFGDLDETASGDPDGDLLTNLEEQTKKTNPTLADTDGDGLDDKAETGTGNWSSSSNTGTDPLSPDSDNDGLPDGVETNTGTFVNGTNTGTNPHLFNTDGDRIGDG
ncbi:MAG: hypothetical protein ACPGUY_05120, partial [Akkermansiaceae bacterium]